MRIDYPAMSAVAFLVTIVRDWTCFCSMSPAWDLRRSWVLFAIIDRLRARGVAVLPVEQNVRAVLKLGDQRICWRWKASSHTARVGHWRRKHRQPETYLLSGPARDGV